MFVFEVFAAIVAFSSSLTISLNAAVLCGDAHIMLGGRIVLVGDVDSTARKGCRRMPLIVIRSSARMASILRIKSRHSSVKHIECIDFEYFRILPGDVLDEKFSRPRICAIRTLTFESLNGRRPQTIAKATTPLKKIYFSRKSCANSHMLHMSDRFPSYGSPLRIWGDAYA